MVQRLGELTGKPQLIRLGARPTASWDPPFIVADIGRLRDEVGFRPTLTLDDGLADTVRRWRPAAT